MMRRSVLAALCALDIACGTNGSDAADAATADGSVEAAIADGAGTEGGSFEASFGLDAGDPCLNIIDFETLPGGAPSEGAPISTQYGATFHVSFTLENGTQPILAKVGDPTTAFERDTGPGDTPLGQSNGSFFLTDDGVVGPAPPPLLITYVTPTKAAYGEILDIDGDEGWTVEALDASDAGVATVVLDAGTQGTGDGVVTPFTFTRPTADIRAIRVRYTGASNVVGLAFDNFSPVCGSPPPH
jgi:hypothetical protein